MTRLVSHAVKRATWSRECLYNPFTTSWFYTRCFVLRRDKEKAEQAAEKEHNRQACGAAKARDSSREGKKKVSKPPTELALESRERCCERRRSYKGPAAPTVVARRNRNVTSQLNTGDTDFAARVCKALVLKISI